MIEYQVAIDLVEEIQKTSDVQHVFIAFMDDAGNYRSIRSSELGASSVKPFVNEVKKDPSHISDYNVIEITSDGLKPNGEAWES